MYLFNNFLTITYRKIRDTLPASVFRTALKLVPVGFTGSVLEVFSLVVLFPVINIVVNPSVIGENKFLSELYNGMGFTHVLTFVLFLFCLILLLFLIKNIVMYMVTSYQAKAAVDIAVTTGFGKFTSYLHKPYAYHAGQNSAILLRNFMAIPVELTYRVVIPFVNLVNELFLLLIVITIVAAFDWLLFLSLTVFTIPFLLLYKQLYRKKLREFSSRTDTFSAQSFKRGQQTMESFREIVVFDKLEYFKPLFKQSIESYHKSLGGQFVMNAFSPRIVETVAMLCVFSIFVFGYFFNRDISAIAQFLILFSVAALRIIPSLNKLILNANYIRSNYFVFDHFSKEDFMVPPQYSTSEQTSRLPFTKTIELKNISFSYPGTNKSVLNSINLSISKKQTIGIIGPSGSGKTTLLNILLRLYKETEGGIYLDGELITTANLKSWYKTLSYVPQNINLLDDSLLENIAFGEGKENANIEKVMEAVKRSQLNDFVKSLPEGLSTSIGEKGVRISGGQRQRLGIARALYHGGDILIFDEATSSLDSETERMLTESIKSLSHQEMTIIIVAHRIQTLKYCDKIYRLENGVLSESALPVEN